MMTQVQRATALFFTLALLPASAGAARAQEAFPFTNPAVLSAMLGASEAIERLASVAAPTADGGGAGVVGGGPGSASANGSTAGMARGVATFRDRQLGYPRVRRAHERKAGVVDALFEAQGVADPAEVFFRVFKREMVLEVWARDRGAERFTLIREYPVCKLSGQLGPKRRQGDGQIPEGFYHIDLFNPWSNYHLSMRVDYPNPVDRARGHATRPGGDIFIHGDCVTIGCVPVTDEYIEEIYLIAVDARAAGQRSIPVHIFPTRLDDAGLEWLRDRFGSAHIDFRFWQNLQEGYRAFEERHVVPAVDHIRDRYVFPAGVPAS